MIDRLTQIKVRKILRNMRNHDAVRYSGPIWMMGIPGRRAVYFGEDYEFRDIWPNKYGLYEWDTERAYIPNSKTRNRMSKIISILDKKKSSRSFIISRYSYTHKTNYYNYYK